MIAGTLAIVSTLLTSAGGASVAPAISTGAASPLSLVGVVGVDHDVGGAASPRRSDARERRTSGDGLEQRRLLAVEVLARALEHGEHTAIDPAGGLHLGDRLLRPARSRGRTST